MSISSLGFVRLLLVPIRNKYQIFSEHLAQVTNHKCAAIYTCASTGEYTAYTNLQETNNINTAKSGDIRRATDYEELERGKINI